MLSLLYGHPQTGSGPASPYLDGVLASTVFDLDATVSASYPGAGVTWANLATPADGSAKSAYDFYRGDGTTVTTYPTFGGSAGDSSAYWEFDGGDYFRLKSETNTTFLNSLHRTDPGQDFWIALAFRVADATAISGLFTTQSGASALGMRLELSTGEVTNAQQRGDSSGATVASVSGSLTIGTNYLLIASYSHANNNWRRWVNTDSATNSSQTYATATGPSSSVAIIGARTAGSQFIPNGARLYSFAMGNEYLDNTMAASIIAHLEARHGRDYTP